MKRSILFLISLLILIAAGVSIYINYHREQIYVRVVNLITEEEEIRVVINDFHIPYDMANGSSSEYFSLPRSFRNIDLKITVVEEKVTVIREINLSSEELNTVFLYREGTEITYLLKHTLQSYSPKETALRVIPQPYLSLDYVISCSDNGIRTALSSEMSNNSGYKLLIEDSYFIDISYSDYSVDYSVFLEGGELYSLIILEGDDNKGHQVRLLVDNLPGDQYITLREQPIRYRSEP